MVLFPTNEEQHIYLDRASFFCLKSYSGNISDLKLTRNATRDRKKNAGQRVSEPAIRTADPIRFHQLRSISLEVRHSHFPVQPSFLEVRAFSLMYDPFP